MQKKKTARSIANQGIIYTLIKERHTSAWQKNTQIADINDISSISQDEDLFDTVFRWPKSAINGIYDELAQNLRFLKIGEYH